MAYIVPDELLQARETVKKKERAFEALQEATAYARRACGAVYGSGVQTSREASPVELAAEEREKALAQCVAACSESLDAERAANTLIEPLPPLEWTVLFRRYIMGQAWEDVAAAMGYTTSHLQRVHRRALEQLTGRGG